MSAYSTRFLVVGILLLSVISVPFVATTEAQAIPSWASSIILTPSSNAPSPGQSLTIKAESYTTDLNSSTVIWTVGEKEQERGIGRTQIAVTAPDLGKTLTVRVAVISSDGQTLRNTLVLGSGDIDLILESNGYVPPFFMGKLSPVYQNVTRVIALPHLANTSGREYDPASLIYQWKKDSTVLQSDSGYGKNILTVAGDIIPRSYMISVTVTSRDGQARAEKYIAISPTEPFILFYQVDPQYGTLYNKARRGTLALGSTKEVSILGVPFGFDKLMTGSGNLNFAWLVNGNVNENLSESESVTLRAPADTAGVAAVELHINNTDKILQGSSNGFTALFSSPKEQAVNTSF
jgi:hypothetical protein